MNYQELVDKCRKAYADKNLELAWKLWEDIHTIICELDTIDIADDEKRKAVWEKYHSYMEQFTNDEVYGITDYGKQKAYRQMEIDRTREILKESVSLYDLVEDKKWKEKMKSLDEFMNFYEWCIIRSDIYIDKYNLYDLQTNEIVDNESKTINEIIDRVVGRAIDYETNETDNRDDEYNYEYAEYLENLYDIAKAYTFGDYDIWLKQFREYVDDYKKLLSDLSICFVCGKEKEDLHSAYCDECWKEEEKRLGIGDENNE